MHELFDTSELTDTPEHWALLAERIAPRAIRTSNGIAWLAHSRAGWMGASAMLAASIVFLVFAPSPSTARSLKDEWICALTARSAVAKAMLADDEPPSLGSLAFPSIAEPR
jgi:hypothetical protein